MTIKYFIPSETSMKQLRQKLMEFKSELEEFSEESVLNRAKIFASEIPREIREVFYEFQVKETSEAILIRTGNLLENSSIKTPKRYEELDSGYQLNDFQMLHALFSSLLGHPIGFASQREGKRLNNIIAVKELEDIPNTSSNSIHDFGFHTEDAFHKFRADYLGLVCIRNTEKVKTNFVSSKFLELDRQTIDELFLDKFIINHNHIHKLNAVIHPPQSIFYGSRKTPFMKINICDMVGTDEASNNALQKLIHALDKTRESVVIEKGDFFYLDNYYTAHGRDAYKPNYGDESRWLSRFIITADIRKSITARASIHSHVIQNND